MGSLKVNIATAAELKALEERCLCLGDDSQESAPTELGNLSIVLHPMHLSLGENEEGQHNCRALTCILSRLSSWGSFKILSLSSPLDRPLRFDWRTLESSSSGHSLGFALSAESPALDSLRARSPFRAVHLGTVSRPCTNDVRLDASFIFFIA
ncbi:hypothetical protein BKA70DRAFT_1356086 [Coprinopsis sp. MPI-PUGE-AT-0042]|nr:hypothetical protein BKA70DRAFT_1356086 [Coprinopsis sp. MPI-PUGE-AT-0042]